MSIIEPTSTRSIVVTPSEVIDARVYLLVVEGTSSRIVDLAPGSTVVIGRGADADVRLADQSVSRRHVEVTTDASEVGVADLGSHNGTRLNGEWLRGKKPFRSGDVVVLGESAIILHVAPRNAPRAQGAIDAETLRARLGAELARALEYERPFAVLALRFEGETKATEAMRAVVASLGPIDLAADDGERRMALVLPELDGEAAGAAARDLLGVAGEGCRAGIAMFPDDGTSSDVLLATARAAAEVAPPGGVARGDDTVRHFERSEALVADPAMLRLHDLAQRLAPSDLPVLVVGETGTGKEHVAHAVHESSARGAGPFVAVNCASIAEALAESELFGHEKGAFSGAIAPKEGLFEAANGGTIFLDEVGELSSPMQAKLLRVLETKRVMRVGSTRERSIDVRVVAATHRKLHEMVTAGRFREDLLFRLAAATVQLPPLRDRPRDIAVLSRAFLSAACARLGRAPMAIGPAAMHALILRRWPGNVRELKNVLEYVAATATELVLQPWHLPAPSPSPSVAPPSPAAGAPPPPESKRSFRPLGEEVRDLERRRMQEALEAADGNQTRAAALIAMPLRTFVTKLKAYGLGQK